MHEGLMESGSRGVTGQVFTRKWGSGWRRSPGHAHPSRRIPILYLVWYYGATVALYGLVLIFFPPVRGILMAPLGAATGVESVPLFEGLPSGPGHDPFLSETMYRAAATLLVMLTAVVVVLPVIWIYMRTKRLRYDPSLVQSMVILPIVVAGVLMIVKHNIAVAFGLVGVVATVRFRNTLDDPKDAAYVFLALGIGLAAGVQALDIALVMSLTFNLVILALWRLQIGSIYGGHYRHTGILSIGDETLWMGETLENRRGTRSQLMETAEKMKMDGVLLVHSVEPERARRVAEDCLKEDAREWELVEVVPRDDQMFTLEYLVDLRRKTSPLELLAELDDRSVDEIASAEYVPYTREDDAKSATARK